MSFQSVTEFEHALCKYFNSPYAVATDCCTHGIELSLRYLQPKNYLTVPRHTYVSIPMTLEKLGLSWGFNEHKWNDYYCIEGTNIIDSAVFWCKGGYVPDSLQCLSFQYKKPLSLGRGGAILCSTYQEYDALKRMSYDGRRQDIPWAKQDIETIGYHYYMTPEIAQEGVAKLPDAYKNATLWTWDNYPDVSKMKVFNGK